MFEKCVSETAGNVRVAGWAPITKRRKFLFYDITSTYAFAVCPIGEEKNYADPAIQLSATCIILAIGKVTLGDLQFISPILPIKAKRYSSVAPRSNPPEEKHMQKKNKKK